VIETLPGAYFYLDNEVRGHFGHMMTEVVSRLWAWHEVRLADPGTKAIMHFNKRRDLAGWEVELLGAAGVPAEDIVFSRRPVRVEHLVSATPMLSNPDYVHPGIADVWRRIGDNLASRSTADDTPRRIFVGRRIRKRPCRNAADVERFFESFGFTVVYPEDHALPDQVRLFRRAELIAGFVGSGMFNLMFTPEPKKTILVSSESYTGRNEVLMAGVWGTNSISPGADRRRNGAVTGSAGATRPGSSSTSTGRAGRSGSGLPRREDDDLDAPDPPNRAGTWLRGQDSTSTGRTPSRNSTGVRTASQGS